MKRQEDKRSISIRNSIIIIFVLSIIISVTAIGIMVFTNWRSSAKKITEIISEDMNNEMFKQIDSLVNTPMYINEVNQKLIYNNIIDLSNEKEREKFFVGVLKSHGNEIYSFSYGTESGEYYGARRNENSDIEIMKNNEETEGHSWYYSVKEDLTADELVMQTGLFDPRTRDWYKIAKQNGHPIFSPVYKHFVMNDLTVSAAWPIYDDSGNLEGVLGTHMLLSEINNNLRKIANEKSGYAFIIEKDSEELIANSFGEANFTISEDGTLKRNRLVNMENEMMQHVYEQYKMNQNVHFFYRGEEEGYHVNVKEYSKEGLDWIIVSVIPSSLLMRDIARNINTTILIVIITVLLSVVVYFFITNKLFRPIGNLIKAMDDLSTGKLSHRISIIRNDEIGKISIMFNEMADKMNHFVDNLETSVQKRTSELMETNDALQRTKEELQLILDTTAEGIFGMDTDGICTFCNNRCIDLLGYEDQHKLVGENMHLLIHHSYGDGRSMPVEECRIRKTSLDGVIVHANDEVFWKANGTNFDVEYYSYPQLKDNRIIGAVVTFMDITERKRNEEQIRYLSGHDPMTGLMNRRYFEDALKENDTKNNLPISIIFADINGLKLVNDVFGHASGDLLIKKCAEILKKSCRNKYILARIGGDEFIVLLPLTQAKDAEKIVEEVRTELSKEKVNGIKCSMALGFDTKTRFYQDIEKTMGSAESEMYKEKSLSRKSFEVDTISTIMNSLQEKDQREKNHSENVASLCAKMGKVLALPETEIKKLRDAGYLHDIGKIILEDHILMKQEDLTENEKNLMRQHPAVGYRILNLFDDTLDLANDVYAHHEKWDGTGYPKGLKGDEIPLKSRIIALTDSYEIKSSKVIEFDTIAREGILQEMHEGSGSFFDPNLTEIFINMIKHADLTSENSV